VLDRSDQSCDVLEVVLKSNSVLGKERAEYYVHQRTFRTCLYTHCECMLVTEVKILESAHNPGEMLNSQENLICNLVIIRKITRLFSLDM
jgi:hypothetical protein